MIRPRLGIKLQTLRNRYSLAHIAVTAVLALTGLGLIVNSTYSHASRPAFTPIETTQSEVPHVRPTEDDASFLSYSEPTSISISAIGIKSEIIQVGKNDDGTLEVPLGKNVTQPGWYKYSPTPGQIGTSVITGHVDQPDGSPNVFFRLGELKKGDVVSVSRQDGTLVEFEVTSNQIYTKTSFPTDEVYGLSDEPMLKLITCGGIFDESSQDYDSNIVVTAKLK